MATYVAVGGLKLRDVRCQGVNHRMSPLKIDEAREAANGLPTFNASTRLRSGDKVISLGKHPACLTVTAD